jgi:protein gp37
MYPWWVRGLRDQCVAAGVPFFFKQWGEYVTLSEMPEDTYRKWDIQHGTEAWTRDDPRWRVGKKAAGRILDGRTWDQFPEVNHG